MIQTKPETRPERKEADASWQLAHEAYPGAIEAARQKARYFIGALAVEKTVCIEPIHGEQEAPTLLSTLNRANKGEADARESVEVNVRTNIAELLFKAGHQTSVELDTTNGKLSQYGDLLADIQANTLRYSTLNNIMLGRTKQEIENIHTFEELLGGDVLKTHDAVVFSLSPDDEKTKKDYGFFEETETCSIQMLRKNDETVTLETALVAGKADATASRHDKTAVETLARNRGVHISLDDAENSLRYVLLVPKTVAPNGVSDVVRIYDETVGEDIFYGQAVTEKPDYLAYAADCEAKNNEFDDAVASITRQLLAEAESFHRPIEAAKRLHKLTEVSLVSRSVTDSSIDERVFGEQAAEYITLARSEMLAGNTEEATSFYQKAVDTAVSSSCPMATGSSELDDNMKNDLSSYGKDQYGTLAFYCPLLGCLNVRKHGELLEKCTHCSADVRC